ncbi:LysR family transcriptional regulator [Cobetia sp. UCD-24C]|uniref:LysR family transcriptional regulator n=1 Tax=Cobetia sp. UCD-24C TaxID=1716176 RepID=UPI0006CA1C1A|nr:LysR family transcriptional regulator [Cobetia sp. UCD-24C]KPM80495.1 XRE family transcriptional regulator [Cobetia sp. UCD-24C]
MPVTFRQLRVFVTVARERTLTAAAKRLFLTKPAVSMALGELERQYDQILFDRHRNRLYLNDYGRQLLPLADELLARSHDIDHLFDEAQISGVLHIGASYTIGHQILPKLLSEFRAISGHEHQQVTIANSTSICRSLEAFDLDIGMIEGRVVDERFSIKPWCHDRMLIAVAADHPLAHRTHVAIEELTNYPWLLREQGSGTREQFIRFVAPHLPQWKLGLEINSAEAIINAAAVGLGITCVSELEAYRALQDGRLKEIPTGIEMYRGFSLILHKDKYCSPLMKLFLDYCLGFDKEALWKTG